MSKYPETLTKLELPAAFILMLLDESAQAVRRALHPPPPLRRPRPGGQTLQPGPDTPLWNELVRQVLPLLKRRGRKVHLARILGVPRQRLQVCLKAKSACLDAERTLLLLAWLARQRQGKTLV